MGFSKYQDSQFAKEGNWNSKDEFALDYIEHMEEKHGALSPIALMLIELIINLLWKRISS